MSKAFGKNIIHHKNLYLQSIVAISMAFGDERKAKDYAQGNANFLADYATRKRQYMHRRAMLSMIMRNHFDYSFSALGRMFGKDHSAIINHLKACDRWVKQQEVCRILVDGKIAAMGFDEVCVTALEIIYADGAEKFITQSNLPPHPPRIHIKRTPYKPGKSLDRLNSNWSIQ